MMQLWRAFFCLQLVTITYRLVYKKWCRRWESNPQIPASKDGRYTNSRTPAEVIGSRERLTIIGGCIPYSRCDATDLSVATLVAAQDSNLQNKRKACALTR